MSNEVISNTNAITLDWADISGAAKYWLEVSKTYIDFRSSLVHEDNNLATSTDTMTATGNGKYFWRYRGYVGGAWQPPREVNSFIVNISASDDVSAVSWMLINKSDISDFYILDPQPFPNRMLPEHLWEAKRRNRKGKLKSEQYMTKATISLDISRVPQGNDQKAEVMRFFNLHTSFYLAVRYDNQILSDFIYRVWEVMFTESPNLDIVGGNILNFEEV